MVGVGTVVGKKMEALAVRLTPPGTAFFVMVETRGQAALRVSYTFTGEVLR